MTTRRLATGKTVKVRRHDGVLKRCACSRRAWPSCQHDWYFMYAWMGRPWRFSLDVELGRHFTTKDEAKAAAEELRIAIRAGTFVRVKDRAKQEPASGPLTFAALADLWLTRASRPNRDRTYARSLAACAAATGEALGTKAATSITEDDLECVFVSLKARGLAASTRNHHLQTVKSIEKWGRRKGYLDKPWLSDLTEIKREQHARRDRRLAPGDQERLLTSASPWLKSFIIAAIETCARRGELLALQWGDVSLSRDEISIRAREVGAKKTGKGRVIPISPRLKGVLDMLRLDPAGNEHPAGAYVFGDAIGRRVGSPATAWETCVLKAYNKPVVRHPRSHALSPESRAALNAIDLHFHDLRHEGASLLLELGWPLHHIQGILGHANIAQTSTYLNVQKTGLQDSMRRFSPTSLHSVAPEPQIERSPECNTEPAIKPQVTVN